MLFYRLRPIDVEFMRRLGKIVSIVPVIAKADTLTLEERLEFKQRVSCPSSTPVRRTSLTFYDMQAKSDSPLYISHPHVNIQPFA